MTLLLVICQRNNKSFDIYAVICRSLVCSLQMKLHALSRTVDFHIIFPKWDFILLKLNDSVLLDEIEQTSKRR